MSAGSEITTTLISSVVVRFKTSHVATNAVAGAPCIPSVRRCWGPTSIDGLILQVRQNSIDSRMPDYTFSSRIELMRAPSARPASVHDARVVNRPVCARA